VIVERLVHLEQHPLRRRVHAGAVARERPVLHDPRVAVQVGEVDVDAVVSVKARGERHRQEPLLAARRGDVGRDVEEGPGEQAAAVPDADLAAAQHDVEVAVMAEHVRRLVEPRHDRVQPGRVGSRRRRRKEGSREPRQAPHPSRHDAAC
jgi:hypothetical protein